MYGIRKRHEVVEMYVLLLLFFESLNISFVWKEGTSHFSFNINFR